MKNEKRRMKNAVFAYCHSATMKRRESHVAGGFASSNSVIRAGRRAFPKQSRTPRQRSCQALASEKSPPRNNFFS
jgi:hypothetical protein